MAQTKIRSPIDGIVLRRAAELGEMVLASNAPALFTIAADLSTVNLRIKVSEADVGKVTLDQNVEFALATLSGRAYGAKIKHIRLAPSSTGGAVYEAILVVENLDLALRPGMTADVTIMVDPTKSATRTAPTEKQTQLWCPPTPLDIQKCRQRLLLT